MTTSSISPLPPLRGDESIAPLRGDGKKYWRAGHWQMVNHKTGKSTVLAWSEFVFGNGFEDQDFNRNSLAKAR